MIKIKNKELKKPIFQGGMGVGVSLSGLAGAVAKAGGAGTISAAQIGFLDPEFDKDPFEANLRAIKSEFDKARKISKDGIIGFNIMVAMQHYEEYVRLLLRQEQIFLYAEQVFQLIFLKLLQMPWKRWINLWRHQHLHQSFQLKNRRV